MRNDENAVTILNQTCKEGHKFSERIKSIGDRVFNTFSKNFTAEINDKIHMEKKRKPKDESKDDPKKNSSARKIKKLQSN